MIYKHTHILALFFTLFFVNSIFCMINAQAAEKKANVPLFCTEINKDDKNDVLKKMQKLHMEEKQPFDDVFETIKEEYHEAINESFNEQIDKLSKNLYQSNGRSDKVCSPFEFEKETKSLKVAHEMIEKFRKYECALTYYIERPPYKGDELYINEGLTNLRNIQSELRQEIRFSYLAIEKSIEMYNELRLWFPIHRDLLCLIEQMKTYRNAVRNFIDQVVRMPAKYYNYGSRYQQ